MSNTTHDIVIDGQSFIMEIRIDENEGNWISLTSTCDDTPCDWVVNDATTPSWVCNTHQYDGTGDYPATGSHPEVCDFSDVDEDGECQTEHTTYDFMEYDQSKQFDAILAKNILARDLRDNRDGRSVLNDLVQLETIEQYTGELNQPSVRDIVEDETGNI